VVFLKKLIANLRVKTSFKKKKDHCEKNTVYLYVRNPQQPFRIISKTTKRASDVNFKFESEASGASSYDPKQVSFSDGVNKTDASLAGDKEGKNNQKQKLLQKCNSWTDSVTTIPKQYLKAFYECIKNDPNMQNTLNGGSWESGNFLCLGSQSSCDLLGTALSVSPASGSEPPSCPEGQEKDCHGVCGGSGSLDCSGICDGNSVKDERGTCCQDYAKDCMGICYGGATISSEGDCCRSLDSHCSFCGSFSEFSAYKSETYGNPNALYDDSSSIKLKCQSDMVVKCEDQDENNYCREWFNTSLGGGGSGGGGSGGGGDSVCENLMPKVKDVMSQNIALDIKIEGYEWWSGKYIVHGEPEQAATEYKYIATENTPQLYDTARIRIKRLGSGRYEWVLLIRFNVSLTIGNQEEWTPVSDWSTDAKFDEQIIFTSKELIFRECTKEDPAKYPWNDEQQSTFQHKWIFDGSSIEFANKVEYIYPTYETKICSEPTIKDGVSGYHVKWQSNVVDNQNYWGIEYLDDGGQVTIKEVDNDLCSVFIALNKSDAEFTFGRIMQSGSYAKTTIKSSNSSCDFKCGQDLKSEASKKLRIDLMVRPVGGSWVGLPTSYMDLTVPYHKNSIWYMDLLINDLKNLNGLKLSTFSYYHWTTKPLQAIKLAYDDETNIDILNSDGELEFHPRVLKFFQKLNTETGLYDNYVTLEMKPVYKGVSVDKVPVKTQTPSPTLTHTQTETQTQTGTQTETRTHTHTQTPMPYYFEFHAMKETLPGLIETCAAGKFDLYLKKSGSSDFIQQGVSKIFTSGSASNGMYDKPLLILGQEDSKIEVEVGDSIKLSHRALGLSGNPNFGTGCYSQFTKLNKVSIETGEVDIGGTEVSPIINGWIKDSEISSHAYGSVGVDTTYELTLTESNISDNLVWCGVMKSTPITNYKVVGGTLSDPYYAFTFQHESWYSDNWKTGDWDIIPGFTYTFQANGVSTSHPFAIGPSWGDTTSLDWVSGSSITGHSGSISFTVPSDYTGKLYYFCTSHSSMIKEIYSGS